MKWSLTVLLSLVCNFSVAETSPLRGVWKIESTVYDGEEQSIRQPEQVKIFTEGHFFYTYYDPNLGTLKPQLAVGHGTYVFNNATLSETIINHSNAELIGQTFTVTIEISSDGDSFQQEVDLGKYILRERWVRAE